MVDVRHRAQTRITGRDRRDRSVVLVVALTALLLFDASAWSPASVVGVEPSPAPIAVDPTPGVAPVVPAPAASASTQPAATLAPAPSTTPEPAATLAPAPSTPPELAPPLADAFEPADELVSERTETSRTYQLGDGRRAIEMFSDPIYYRPSADAELVAIEPGFRPAPGVGKAAVSDRAPAAVTVAPANDPRGFVTVATLDGFRVAYRPVLAPGAPTDPVARATEPTTNGARADVAEVFPGVDVRVVAQAAGAAVFLVLREAPKVASWTFVVDLPKGADLRLAKDGGIDILDTAGVVQLRLSAPYAVDSTPDAFTGSGRTTSAVSYALGEDTGSPTITVSVDDPAWLADAVYPVYVDPSTTIYNEGSTANGDAHVMSGSGAAINYANYLRPDAPGYYEMWLGKSPSDLRTARAFMNFATGAINDKAIDSATLEVRPYHQYYDAPTATRTYLRRVTADWAENTITWNNQPATTATGEKFADCVEGQQCAFDVTTIARGWIDDAWPDYGFRLHEPDDITYWKRLIAAEQQTNTRPRLIVVYHDLTTTVTTPAFSPALTWTFTDAAGHAQSRYRIQIATDAAFANLLVNTPIVASAERSYAPAPGVLGDLALYYYRVKAGDGSGMSPWSTGTFTFDGANRGVEAYLPSVPFELGGGLRLDVGPHNGEARLARNLFEIPTFGPANALSLTYSSLEATKTGRFGYGWNSNLTEYLTFQTGLVIWHRADGARVAFPNAGLPASALGGHFEKLSPVVSAEYTITRTDQSKLVFESSGAGRLKRIVDRFGKALSINWGLTPARATDASGRWTELTLDAVNDRISQVKDSAGRIWGFGYSAGHDLTTITDPAGKVTTLGYTARRLTSVSRQRNPGNLTTLWSIGYSQVGTTPYYRATSVTDPVNASVANTFAYSAGSTSVGLLQTYSPTIRNTTTYQLDALGRATVVTEPLNLMTTRTFDVRSNVTSIVRLIQTTPPVSRTTTFEFAPGTENVTKERVQVGSSLYAETVSTYNATTNDLLTRTESNDVAATRLVTKYGYDGAGRLVTVNVNCTTAGLTPPTDGSTCTGAGTQDAATNLTTAYTYTANDQLEHETDPLGRVTRRTYDAQGRPTTEIANYVAGQSATAERNVTTTQAYAANQAGDAGLMTSSTDATGAVTTYGYDALGRQTSETLPGDATVPALTRQMTYDELGNLLTETERWFPLGGGAEIVRTTTHAYDAANRETSVTDPTGVATTTAFDAAGNAITSSAAGVTTQRTFDGLGMLSTETVAGVVNSFAYDFDGNLVEQQVDGVTSEWLYDIGGRLTDHVVDSAGLALFTSYAYDVLGRELSRTDPSGVVTTTLYDRVGRPVTVIENDVATPTSPDEDQVTTTTYDRVGNAVATTDPAGRTTSRAFDPLDREIATVGNDVAGTSSAPDQDLTTSTYFDAAGRVVAVRDATKPTGRTVRTVPNVRGLDGQRVENCTDAAGNAPADPATCPLNSPPTPASNIVTSYRYDGSGQLLDSTRVSGAGSVRNAETFDAAGRLLTSVIDAGALNLTTEYAYDPSGRQTAVKDPRGTISRTLYDTSGRLFKTIVNCTDTGTIVPGDPAWRTCTGSGSQDGTFNATTSYGYDDRGNRTSETAPNGRVTTYVYDDADRMIQRIDNDVATPTTADQDLSTYFAHDADGRQVAVRMPTVDRTTFSVTRSLYDDLGRLVKEIRRCTNSGTTSPPDPDWKTCAGTGTANADTNVVVDYAYDTRGNRIRLIAPDPSATTGTSTATVITQSAFDGADRLCRVVENATGSTNLQALANPCADVTQTAGTTTTNVSTRYTYDATGNMVTMIDAKGATTTYGYDAAGRLTSLTDPLGGALVWTYDALGNKLNQRNRTDPLLTVSVAWTYDGAGRILTRTADGVTTTYTYDATGNKLTATTGSQAISTTYDRLGRPLTIDDEDAGTTPDTTYTYSLTSPAWSDPSGSYSATLDRFDRPTAVNDPVNATDFTWTYRADGQAGSFAQPNGNTTALAYDAVGRLVSKDTGSLALYDWTYNRAGQVLTEASTISGDPSNGTVTYTRDPLERLTGATLAGATTAYGWAAVPNRTSVQTGAGTPATTAYDAADRPTSGANPPATYTSDPDGRLTAAPSYQYAWDRLGRLTTVRNGAGTTLATYTYDPLDRLRLVDDGAGTRTRFRYVGLTTAVAQWLDDATGTVTRSVANGWTGERLADWTGAGSDLRVYGTNAHHDTTWLATGSGSVSAALRYDPWGSPRGPVPTGYSPFRFQGAWSDATTDLSWVVTRWYAPSMGRFISEDSLLGSPADPPSRHLYAYAEGEPIRRWDPDGRYWYVVRSGDTLAGIASRRLQQSSNWPMIYNANRSNSSVVKSTSTIVAGECLWIPWRWVSYSSSGFSSDSRCSGRTKPSSYRRVNKLLDGGSGYSGMIFQTAAEKLGVPWPGFVNLSPQKLYSLTTRWAGRTKRDIQITEAINDNLYWPNRLARQTISAAKVPGTRVGWNGLTEVYGNSEWPGAFAASAFTMGTYIFYESKTPPAPKWLRSHEYIHVLQFESFGLGLLDYLRYSELEGYRGGPGNPYEAIGYLWQGWTWAYGETSYSRYWRPAP